MANMREISAPEIQNWRVVIGCYPRSLEGERLPSAGRRAAIAYWLDRLPGEADAELEACGCEEPVQ